MIAIIAAGLLALPALLVQVATALIVAFLSVPALCILLFRKPRHLRPNLGDPDGDAHVIITGGSSGIGLSIARECARRGVRRVTILARTVSKLETAKKELEELNAQSKKTKQIKAVSVDVTDYKALEKTALELLGKTPSHSTYLFCCAGETEPAYFDDIPPDVFARITQTNQLGSIYTTKAFLPHMKAGTICFCSSICGQIGIFGYSAYSPTKFALRGFAECLHVELCNSPVNVQIAYPPDTDTPGFEKENVGKPKETQLISEQGGLSKPDDIARVMVTEAFRPNPRFNVYFTFDAWMLSSLTAGFSPIATMQDGVSQVAGMTLFRFVSLFYLHDWWRIVRKFQEERDAEMSKTK
jgi:3-dehydrosphinganine reductase|uniref:3-dehydrosphinganine reductase n=1 Tax=Phaeodactylum tricornutum TaxID=2850 RepID=A0A8J9TBM0_PHATR